MALRRSDDQVDPRVAQKRICWRRVHQCLRRSKGQWVDRGRMGSQLARLVRGRRGQLFQWYAVDVVEFLMWTTDGEPGELWCWLSSHAIWFLSQCADSASGSCLPARPFAGERRVGRVGSNQSKRVPRHVVSRSYSTQPSF